MSEIRAFDRRHNRVHGPVFAGVMLAFVLVGCTATTPELTPASPTPSLSADWDEVPQSEGLAEIEVDGTEGSPIMWQLPAETSEADPVGVTQRFMALYLHAGTPGAEQRPELSTSVADDGALATLRLQLLDPASDGDERSAGPLWIWLDDADPKGDRATVRGCMDVAYFQPYGSLVNSRAQAWNAELVRVDDFDGQEVWRVYRFSAGPTNDVDPFESQCPAWATHTP
jgi:hypothetical protein